MNIPFSCPSCDAKYRADETFAGKTGKCKHCGSTLRVPTKEEAIEYETTKEIVRKYTKISKTIQTFLIILVGIFIVFAIYSLIFK
jgi:transcription initiation factor IIE alpha subunit